MFKKYKIFKIIIAIYLSLLIINIGSFFLFENKYLNENDFINKKKLKNHYENFSPIDLIREKSKYNFINEKKIYLFSGVANGIAVNKCNNFYNKYKMDKYGFRNESKYWNKAKIFVFGDSLVLAPCVTKNFIDYINLQRKEKIINTAQSGNNIYVNFAILKEILENQNILNAIFFVAEDNLYFSSLGKQNKILNNYINNKEFSQKYFFKKIQYDQILIKNNKSIKEKQLSESKKNNFTFNRLFNLYFFKRLKHHLIFKIKNMNDETFQEKNFTSETEKNKIINENIKDFIRLIVYVEKLSKEKKFNFKLVLLPNKKDNHKKKEIVEILKKNLDELNIKFIDLKELFKIQDINTNIIYQEDGSHFNDKGNQIIAKLLKHTIDK